MDPLRHPQFFQIGSSFFPRNADLLATLNGHVNQSVTRAGAMAEKEAQVSRPDSGEGFEWWAGRESNPQSFRGWFTAT